MLSTTTPSPSAWRCATASTSKRSTISSSATARSQRSRRARWPGPARASARSPGRRPRQARTRWKTTWGYDLSGTYAKIFAYARANRIPLVGLNAPYALVKMVANYGLGAMPSELQPFLPEIDLRNEEHFERFASDMGAAHGGEGMPRASLRRSYEAMTLWDEYMAESVAQYMAKHRGRMVVLAGTSHVRGRVGVPDRYSRRSGRRTFSIVPYAVPWAANGLPAIDAPLGPSEAEWILYTQGEIDPGAAPPPGGTPRVWM